MAGATVTAISDVLKFRYLGPIRDQLNNEVLITQILELDKDNVDLDGLKAVVPLHYGRNSGVGARREDEVLPTAGAQAYKQAQFDLAYLYGTARFTGQAIQKTKTDAGSFVRVITSELDQLRKDLALDTARQLYGDGTGVMATIASVAGSVLTLTSSEAIDKGYLTLNGVIDVATGVTPGSFKVQGSSITDVNPATPSITVSAPGTAAGADNIFRASSVDASGTKEINAGLQALLPTATNTVGGINAASAGLKWWDNQRDVSGGAISLSNMMINWNKVRAAGVNPADVAVLTTPGLVRRLFETADFKANVRFAESDELQGGFERISFATGSGRLGMTTDRLAPYGKVHFVDKSTLKVYSPGDWDYISKDGLTIRQDPTKDAYNSYLFRYINLGVSQRNNQLVMTGLTDTGF
jgi:hypothetical protein